MKRFGMVLLMVSAERKFESNETLQYQNVRVIKKRTADHSNAPSLRCPTRDLHLSLAVVEYMK